MDYALVLNLEKKNIVGLNWLTRILGKPLIEFMIDILLESGLKKLVCLSREILSLSENKDINIVLENQLDSFKEHLKEEGCTIVVSENTYIIDEAVLQALRNHHKKNGNALTMGMSGSKEIKQENYEWNIICINNDFLLEVISNYLKWSDTIKTTNKKIDYYDIEDYQMICIDSFYKLNQVEANLRKKINERHLYHGIYLENLETITIGPDVVIESNCKIRSGSIIFGKSIIKSGAIIGPNSEINDSYIGENSVVMQSVVNISSIGKNAKIGPFSHLRMNSLIGDDDRIGNFVEIKNSSIGKKTNVSHLTYVGDTDCGNGVNFGCGVVTVNYNGKNKFKTTIGNNVFIGCNSNLIAPIKIENGAFIAAGSTITEDMDVDDFAISRVEQITKKGYARKYGYMKFFNKEDSKKSNLKD